MNRPEPEHPAGMALEQLNDAVRSIYRKWRARRAAKAARPEDGAAKPPPPGSS